MIWFGLFDWRGNGLVEPFPRFFSTANGLAFKREQ
jgi:hypothetical protein